MRPEALLALLADGEFHSGEHIGARSGLTRAAVWKQMRKLEQWGLQVEASRGRGYRLSQPIELFDAPRLRTLLAADERFDFARLSVFFETDSTNRYLMQHPPPRAAALVAALAEWQSAGRGRLQRQWNSPAGSGICLSVGWTFEGTPETFSFLSLAAGAAIAAAVSAHCGIALQLKWPNDILWQGRKLGGVLVESRIESHGQCQVVIGVGINASVSDAQLAHISDWPGGAVDLRTALAGANCSRNELTAAIAANLGAFLADYASGTAMQWRRAWREMDFLHGKPIRVHCQTAAFDGTAGGIDDSGALLVRDASGATRRVVAGDASVRTV